MPRALLSVSDKTGLIPFAQALTALGWDLVASGGTQATLGAAGLKVIAVETLTQVPEMLGGRVKTLHPAIHAGILAQDTESDLAELRAAGYAPIDLVVCNLYPFQEATRQSDLSLPAAIEYIDIGGVTLLRAAAKNFSRVTVAIDPSDYPLILSELQARAATSLGLRQKLARKAFAHTRDYDTAIEAYLGQKLDDPEETPAGIPPHFSLSVHQSQSLRYGENPHQNAGYFAASPDIQPLHSELLAGKPLSYNNILDADAAWRAASAFDPAKEAAVVIVKHLTPCGIAIGASPEAAYPFALESDEVSAFGGVIALNRAVNRAFVEALGTLFLEVIIAPDFEPEAAQLLAEGRKNCRLLKVNPAIKGPALEFRSVLGGVLIQERDQGDPADTAWKVVSKRAPTDSELETLRFAWTAVEHVKSNAIVLAHQGATVGIGGGVSSRLDAAKLALEKAGRRAKGAVMASDAFFPFPDAIEGALQAGVTAIIQPGGALRDQQVIEAADAAGVAMVFTGVRHFRH
jgi:phosphoribosylaminoimidazolecarboxamide formyltransferase/IMP cyclohydrolase